MLNNNLMEAHEEYRTEPNDEILIHETSELGDANRSTTSPPTEASTIRIPPLSFPLQVLFCLNGATLSLPGLALMQILNDRAKVPLNLMSAYGAIAFLPFSLKPFYSMMELCWTESRLSSILFKKHHPRSVLIAILLLTSSVSIGLTACIPTGGVLWCFILGFLRGITIAFPEFLLGLTLLEDAKDVSSESVAREDDLESYSFESVSGVFQAQAATSRNVGSFLSGLGLFIFLAVREFYIKDDGDGSGGSSLGDAASSGMLIFTSLLPIVGAWIAIQYKVGSSVSRNDPWRSGGIKRNTNGYTTVTDDSSTVAVAEAVYPINHDLLLQDESVKTGDICEEITVGQVCALFPSNAVTAELVIEDNNQTNNAQLPPSSPGTIFPTELVTIVAFQILLIWIGIKGIIAPSHPLIWNIIAMMTACVMFTGVVARFFSSHQLPQIIQYGPAFFLTLKQAMPSASYQAASYTYFLFGGYPIYLQLLSLIGSAMSTAGSGTYARFIAPLKNISLSHVIFVTTVVSVSVSLSSLILAVRWDDDPKGNVLRNFLIAVPVSAFSTYFGEISFLPSVVLATASVRFEEKEDEGGDGVDGRAACDDGDVCGLEDPRASQAAESLGGRNGLFSKEASLVVHDDKSRDIGNCTVSDDAQECRIMYASTVENEDAAPSQFESRNKGNQGIQYGTYISCIDFGDQIGAWISVPIVSAIGISRDDWSRLPELLLICSGLSLLPLIFLFLLEKDKRK